ncbi:MAG: hypothetical protein ACU83N_09965 [Gammaproteobacteria bacterium]
MWSELARLFGFDRLESLIKQRQSAQERHDDLCNAHHRQYDHRACCAGCKAHRLAILEAALNLAHIKYEAALEAQERAAH